MVKNMQLLVAVTCMLVLPTGVASDTIIQVANKKNESKLAIVKYENKKVQKQKDDGIKVAKVYEITTTKKPEKKKVEKVNDTKTINTTTENTETKPAEETKQNTTVQVAKVTRKTTNVTSRSSNSIQKKKTQTTKKQTSNTQVTSQQSTSSNSGTWSGKKLTRSAGVVPEGQTPSGYRETYYNLNMNGCIKLMGLPLSGMGVRADGVKTYNGYVMVASPNLKAHPKGSYINTTLGMGIVVDYCPGGSLDIAVTW